MQQKDVETQNSPCTQRVVTFLVLFFDDNDEKKFCVKFNSEQQNSFHDGMTMEIMQGCQVSKIMFSREFRHLSSEIKILLQSLQTPK